MGTVLLILSLLGGEISSEYNCLREAIYYEAGNQSAIGKLAVGQVIKNRVGDSRWPDSFCQVIKEKDQFSYYWDGKPEPIPKLDNRLERQAAFVSSWVTLVVFLPLPDITKGSLYYHSTKIKSPHWTAKLVSFQVGDHILYTD